MAFLASTFFGLNKQYNLAGVRINFNKEEPGRDVFGGSFFSKATNALLGNPVVKIATFGYLHVLIHELGHILAGVFSGSRNPKINIYTKTCRGSANTEGHSSIFISVAGPILGILWEIAKLTAAIAMIVLLPPPIGLPLGIFLGLGSAFWLFGEAAYACSRSGDWDF